MSVFSRKKKDNLSERYKYSDSFEPRKLVGFRRKTTIRGIRFYDFDASSIVFDECCLFPKMGITWKYRSLRIAVELTPTVKIRPGMINERSSIRSNRMLPGDLRGSMRAVLCGKTSKSAALRKFCVFAETKTPEWKKKNARECFNRMSKKPRVVYSTLIVLGFRNCIAYFC